VDVPVFIGVSLACATDAVNWSTEITVRSPVIPSQFLNKDDFLDKTLLRGEMKLPKNGWQRLTRQ
jgi:hypothetical protein